MLCDSEIEVLNETDVDLLVASEIDWLKDVDNERPAIRFFSISWLILTDCERLVLTDWDWLNEEDND